MDPATRISRIAVAVLVKEREAVNPETGLIEPVPFPEETLEEIRKLVAGVVGLNEERGDLVTVTAQPFVQQLDESVKVEWFEMGWIKLAGRREVPGRPVIYATTPEFLDHFGLSSRRDLPGIDELKAAGLLDPVEDAYDAMQEEADTKEQNSDDVDEDADETAFADEENAESAEPSAA
ncbi:MAG: hypothetical protein EBS78_04790 [Altererythrobacter sp.]|nr:hypothetical protein [Altererythrobacter sp.]